MFIKIALLIDFLFVIFIIVGDPNAWFAIIAYAVFVLGLVITGWFKDEFSRHSKRKNNKEED